MTQQQLVLDPTDGRCEYGLPKVGQRRRCHELATHAAVWALPADDPRCSDRDVCTGRVHCCVRHANYYAEAWCDWWWAPGSSVSVWMERL